MLLSRFTFHVSRVTYCLTTPTNSPGSAIDSWMDKMAPDPSKEYIMMPKNTGSPPQFAICTSAVWPAHDEGGESGRRGVEGGGERGIAQRHNVASSSLSALVQ